jgi:hypothetical protein
MPCWAKRAYHRAWSGWAKQVVPCPPNGLPARPKHGSARASGWPEPITCRVGSCSCQAKSCGSRASPFTTGQIFRTTRMCDQQWHGSGSECVGQRGAAAVRWERVTLWRAGMGGLALHLAWQLSASHTRVRQRRSVAEAGDSISEQQQAAASGAC